MVVSLKSELLPSSPIDPLTSKIIPIEENLTKEFQDGEEVLTEIAEIMGNVASLNLRNDIEDLIDAREQITNLSNHTYLQQIHLNILNDDGNIIFDLLHQLRKYHKAYTSKKNDYNFKKEIVIHQKLIHLLLAK